MSVKIRLTRKGKKGVPYYRLVVIDSRVRREGLPIDTIGVYQPLHNPVTIKVDEEKAIKWLKEGAIPSTTVRSIFKKQGILKKLHEEQFSQAKKKVKTEKPVPDIFNQGIATEKQEETPDIKSSEESSN